MKRIALVGSVLLAACSGKVTSHSTNSTPATIALPAPTARCHVRGERGQLPDPSCTPGATNPAVTQATIAETICVQGWTATVRPPASYTGALKRRQMIDYGFSGSPSAYEEDHLIPIGLGGNPSDPRNLWPEPGGSPNPKDEVEATATRAVCEGRISLSQAQRLIASDWVSFGRQLGVRSAGAN